MKLIDLMCCRRNNGAVVFVSDRNMSPKGQESKKSFDLENDLFREYQARVGKAELRRRDSYDRVGTMSL